MRRALHERGTALSGLLLALATCRIAPGEPAPEAPRAGASVTRWKLVRHETFDTPLREPASWVEDTYGAESPYHVDAFDEDGDFFIEHGKDTFLTGLKSFRSFRKSFTYGDDGWLTLELYGRDSDRDGVPETGGKFIAERGRAKLVSTRHYDGAIVRSTQALPARYRVEVTVSNIHFGGRDGKSFRSGGSTNGYDGDEIADPWRFSDRSPNPAPAITDNGVYFLCISDYARPAPHNNVFIHHHRKVVMDTDNNESDGRSWSKVWDPLAGRGVEEGSHYVSMIWLRGDDFGSEWTGNRFLSYTRGGFREDETFVDQYLADEAYVFSIERDGEAFTMSASGRFARGGATSYRATRPMRGPPPIWHYNRAAEEYREPVFDQVKTYLGNAHHTWPSGSAYPEHFFFGDPHINFYEGSAEFDDLKLYLPE